MKHVPTILDYVLLLDYAVSDGKANPVPPNKEKTEVEKQYMIWDNYYWLYHQGYFYKTPFRSDKGLKIAHRNMLISLLDVWAHQYAQFAQTIWIKHIYLYKYISVRGYTTITDPFGAEYGLCLLLYVLSTLVAKRGYSETSIIDEYYIWDKPGEINKVNLGNCVVTVTDDKTGNLVPAVPMYGLGTSSLYLFEEGKTYTVRVTGTDTKDTFSGDVYLGIIIGFIFDPKVINIPLVDQLVNTGALVTSIDKETKNSLPNSIGFARVNRILDSLSNAVLPLILPIRKAPSSGSLNLYTKLDSMGVISDIIGYIDPETGITGGRIPNYFDQLWIADLDFHGAIMRKIETILSVGITPPDVPVWYGWFIDNVSSSLVNSFKSRLVNRLEQLKISPYQIISYDMTNEQETKKVGDASSKVLFLYNPLDPILIDGILLEHFKGSKYDFYSGIELGKHLRQGNVANLFSTTNKKVHEIKVDRKWGDYADFVRE